MKYKHVRVDEGMNHIYCLTPNTKYIVIALYYTIQADPDEENALFIHILRPKISDYFAYITAL